MASYHLSAQPVKRSEGRSVVAMAAYRAGGALKDDRRGTVVDYSRRRGVVHEEIIVPDGCAEWLGDRETLWNHVEAVEIRRDAQLAREINMALPHELTADERLELVRTFVRGQFTPLGMVVDVAIHAPVPEKGDDPRNFHAHLLMTMRQATPLGLRRVKTREWNSDAMLIRWREAWASHQNRALRGRGHAARVDHRSLIAQKATALSRGDRARANGLERLPEVHVGPKGRKAYAAPREDSAQARALGHQLDISRGPTAKKDVRVVRRVASSGKPASKDRPTGPVRSASDGKHRRRTVHYTKLDQGSRAQFNSRRLRLNATRFAASAAKAQRQIARLRTRQAYYVAKVRESGAAAEAREDRASAWERTLHARQRAAQIQWLISELDRLFFELLHLRENQLVRLTVWSNRFGYWRQDLSHLHVRGRSRSRAAEHRGR